MKSIIKVLAIAVVMTALILAMVAPAFARQGFGGCDPIFGCGGGGSGKGGGGGGGQCASPSPGPQGQGTGGGKGGGDTEVRACQIEFP